MYKISLDTNSSDRKIYNSMESLCVWNLHQFDNAHVGDKPDGFIREMYPYVDYLILMTFTGGKKGKDFNNWYSEDENGNPVYDFSMPLEVIDNVLRGGVKPYIVLGQVPNELSKEPSDYGEPSTLWGNRYAPKCYKKYYDYMLAFGKTLAEKYGKEEIKSWKFRFMTEWDDYETSYFWWKESLEEYLKIYDYTVAALEEAFGKENLYIGIGNVTRLRQYPIEKALEHCESGVNYCTGEIGTKCDHISESKYFENLNVEVIGEDAEYMSELVEKYPKLGISQIGYGEGGFIWDKNNNRLHMAQGITEDFGSAAARMFIVANESKKRNSYFANWEYLTDRNNYNIDFMPEHNIKTPAAYSAELLTKMFGEDVIVTSGSLPSSVSVLASKSSDNKTLHVLVCNHPDTIDAGNDVELEINLGQLKPSNIKHYLVDSDHGNFSKYWLEDSKDMIRKHIKFDINTEGSSVLDSSVSLYLNKEDFAFWQKEKPKYATLSDNTDLGTVAISCDNTLSLTSKVYSVNLFEISL